MYAVIAMQNPGDKAANETRIGATTEFAYVTVERFRKAFPRPRWNEEKGTWFVPGTTASKRIAKWLARENESHGLHADSKGRDAYVFEPISSRYLEFAEDIRVRTPYSRAAVEHLRSIPWARWDDQLRAWRVPFRSYEVLRRIWPAIEAAARRSEPDERKRRRKEERLTPRYETAKLRNNERRRRRYPVPADGQPPIGRAVMTPPYGVVLVTDITGEYAEPEDIRRYYPHVTADTRDFVWARWRPASLLELVATWPARHRPNDAEIDRGWWLPNLEELRAARSQARSLERRKQRATTGMNQTGPELFTRPDRSVP